jgi:CHAT domain-containing protein
VGTAWATGFSRGEDYATLARAFLYAGAENVVATLWRVEDGGAAAFASAFYRELGGGSYGEAGLGALGGGAAGPRAGLAGVLARAQRAMMSHPLYSAPYYWAGYQLSGSGRNAQSRTANDVP